MNHVMMELCKDLDEEPLMQQRFRKEDESKIKLELEEGEREKREERRRVRMAMKQLKEAYVIRSSFENTREFLYDMTDIVEGQFCLLTKEALERND